MFSSFTNPRPEPAQISVPVQPTTTSHTKLSAPSCVRGGRVSCECGMAKAKAGYLYRLFQAKNRFEERIVSVSATIRGKDKTLGVRLLLWHVLLPHPGLVSLSGSINELR